MKPEKPAQGISIDAVFSDAKVFSIECDCGSKDHAVKMWVEIAGDAELPMVEVTFYVDTWTPNWSSWKDRAKAVFDILFKGVHKQQHELILTQQAAINLAAAISKTVKELEKKQ